MNQYLKDYIKTQSVRRAVEANEDRLTFRTDQITIKPTHFNYFYFYMELANPDKPVTLNVEELRKMATWILEVTEGITNDDTKNINKEIADIRWE